MVNNIIYSCDLSEKTYGHNQQLSPHVVSIKDMIKDALKTVECMSTKPIKVNQLPSADNSCVGLSIECQYDLTCTLNTVR